MPAPMPYELPEDKNLGPSDLAGPPLYRVVSPTSALNEERALIMVGMWVFVCYMTIMVGRIFLGPMGMGAALMATPFIFHRALRRYSFPPHADALRVGVGVMFGLLVLVHL